jgi:hypothetical protein
MQVADVVRRVRESAGDIAVLQFSNAVLTDWINDAIRECVIENNLLQARATTSTVASQADYTLPTDIFKLHSVVLEGYKLEVLTLEQWQERNASGSGATIPTGASFNCYIYAGVLTLFPTPDKVMSMQVNYIKHPAKITYNSGSSTWDINDLPIPEHYHNRIVTYCLAQVAMQDDDYDKYQALMTEFRTGVVDLKKAKDQEDDLYPFISVSSRDMGDAWYGDHYIP